MLLIDEDIFWCSRNYLGKGKWKVRKKKKAQNRLGMYEKVQCLYHKQLSISPLADDVIRVFY